jgi:hypothetical protein
MAMIFQQGRAQGMHTLAMGFAHSMKLLLGPTKEGSKVTNRKCAVESPTPAIGHFTTRPMAKDLRRGLTFPIVASRARHS